MRSYLKRRKVRMDPREILDEWALTLHHSLFCKSYLVKYIPAVESFSFQWVPPWANLTWAAEIRDNSLRQELSATVINLSFDEFEYLMKQVLNKTSWARDVFVTKISRDDGVDFEGKFMEKSSGLLLPLVGQAKHWKGKVGSEAIRTFLGSIAVRNDHRNVIGVYVSTHGYTEDALRMMRKSPNTIISFDLERLVEHMISNRIGVSQISIKGMGLDSGFWDDLRV